MTYCCRMRVINHVASLELGYNVAVLEVEMSIRICTKHQLRVLCFAFTAQFVGVLPQFVSTLAGNTTHHD